MDVSQFTALLQVLGRIAVAMENQATHLGYIRFAVMGDEVNQVKRIADSLKQIDASLELIAEDLHDSEDEPYLNLLVNFVREGAVVLQGLNTHPGFEAIQNIASTLDSIRRVGLPVEQG